MKQNLLFVAALLSLAPSAQAWGPEGHQIVASVGASVSGQQEVAFFKANAEGMRKLSTVPDRLWKSPATKAKEESTHWFQADAYVPDINRCEEILNFPKNYKDAVAEYGAPMVLKNGSAPWRVIQMYNLALTSLRAGDLAKALEAVGVMSHYVGDLAMPLHVSENYDGQKTGNKGIHAFFETQIIDNESAIRADVAQKTAALLEDPAFLRESNGDLADILNHQIIRSLLKRDQVLANDSKYGRKNTKGVKIQRALAKECMADGAAVLAIVLKRLWDEAGVAPTSQVVPAQDPSWIKPNY